MDGEPGAELRAEGRDQELVQELKRKQEESSALGQSLLQAASMGQELLEENERLKREVERLRHSPPPSLVDSSSRTNSPTRSPPISPGQRKRILTNEDLLRLKLGRRRTTTEDSWEAEGRERREMEEEHSELTARVAELQEKLEAEQQARRAAEVAEAQLRQRGASWQPQGEPPAAGPSSLQEIERLEQHVRSSMREDFQEELDSLTRTREASDQEAGRLRAELQQVSAALGQSNVTIMELVGQNAQYNRQLQDAQSAQAEMQQDAELEHIRESAVAMQRSIHQLRSRRQSLVQSEQTWFNQMRAGSGDPKGSLLDQLQPASDDVADLQKENENLISEVEIIRSQLEELQSRHCGFGGGDTAAGEASGQKAELALTIQGLQAEMELARSEAKETAEQLARQSLAPVAEEKDEAEGFLEGLANLFAKHMCCTQKERSVTSDIYKGLLSERHRHRAESGSGFPRSAAWEGPS